MVEQIPFFCLLTLLVKNKPLNSSRVDFLYETMCAHRRAGHFKETRKCVEKK